MDQIKIGKFIAECRKKKNLTQDELAKLLTVTPQAISKWESEQAKPEVDKVKEISKVFNVSIEYLLLIDSLTTIYNIPFVMYPTPVREDKKEEILTMKKDFEIETFEEDEKKNYFSMRSCLWYFAWPDNQTLNLEFYGFGAEH